MVKLITNMDIRLEERLKGDIPELPKENAACSIYLQEHYKPDGEVKVYKFPDGTHLVTCTASCPYNHRSNEVFNDFPICSTKGLVKKE